MQKTDSLEVFTVTLLHYKDQFLLLHRSQEKKFAPGRWTGIGGHVEADEYDRLRAAALREVQEEAGLSAQDIQNFVFRRALLVSRPHQPLGVLLYFTGALNYLSTPECSEGTLSWKHEDEFERLDIIETTRPVLNLLVKDMENDLCGVDLPKIGLAVFDPIGKFQKIVWADWEDHPE